ncbi:MAG: S8 family serine peptidase [Acidobacteria bacterium]|nr:S8 family serine peptidase [Acidobacteriota bacterium]
MPSTGKAVRVAVIDSGVHAAHPHVRGVADGVQITSDLEIRADFVDRLGHGTAVTAAIKEKAPLVDIIAVKVFDRALSTSAEALARGIEVAVDHGANLINLSLGTTRQEHRAVLEPAVELASGAGVAIIAAAPSADEPWLPGALPEVIAVALDWECPRDRYRLIVLESGRPAFSASGYPRPIPGVPPERNLKGLSFAVANLTGFAALAIEGRGRITSEELVTILAEAVRGRGRSPIPDP